MKGFSPFGGTKFGTKAKIGRYGEGGEGE